MSISTSIKILESEDEWRKAFKLLRQLREDLQEKPFLENRQFFINSGYSLFGLIIENQIVAVAGVDIYPHISRKIDCWIHDLVTAQEYRSKGYGQKLIEYIQDWAQLKGCSRICVHTRNHRDDAKRFYEQKLNYSNAAVVYYKEL